MAKTKKEKLPKTVAVQMNTGEFVEVETNKRSNLSRRERTGYAFVTPYVIAFLIFSVYPVINTFYLSFCQYKGGIGQSPEVIGIDKYVLVLQDPIFWQSLVNTIKIWGVNIVLQLGLAFLLTIIFGDIKYKIRGLAVYRAIYYLPNIIAATSIAFLFSTMLDARYGTFNQILAKIVGHPVITEWIGSPKITFATIGVIQAWMWFGNSFIMLMAGVMGISRDYYEAAAIDGAGRWRQFTDITLPLLKPIMLYVGVTSLIGGLQMFDLPQIMIGQTSQAYESIRTVIMYLYKFGFGQYQVKDVGKAAAIAYILFFIILVFSILQFILMRDDEED